MTIFLIAAAVFIILAVLFGAIVGRYGAPKSKGARGEQYVSKILRSCLRSEHEHVIDNLILYNPQNDSSSQIDHIFIGSNGVFVIETKNYTGKIHGSDGESEWTQYLADGNVQNKLRSPVRQNAAHLYIVRAILGKHIPVHGLVVFVQGNTGYIASRFVCSPSELEARLHPAGPHAPALTERQTDEICSALYAHRDRYPVSEEMHKAHIRKMRTDLAAGICPRCGSPLVLRRGKYGDFYGCSNYPKCRFIKRDD